MAGARIDLDAARAARQEASGEGPVIVWGGQDYTLPAEIPFETAEELSRLEAAHAAENDVEATDAIIKAISSLLGAEQYERFAAGRPSVDDMAALVDGLSEAYGFEQPGESPASPAS